MRCRFPSPIALAVLVLIPLSIRGIAQSQVKPSEPIAGIREAFKTRQLVGIPDAHRNTATHAFLLSLIRDPRFPTVVNDIVVEFGNALHQDVADRFVRGEPLGQRHTTRAHFHVRRIGPVPSLVVLRGTDMGAALSRTTALAPAK
jgi:hypothetical protein